jgi:aspartyl aminopeptidase
MTMALNQALIDFIHQSGSSFHAVKSMKARLDAAGFTPLKESSSWQLKPGNGYYLTRNDSSIIAFRYGTENLAEKGIRMVGAHTDSPTLKVKPNPDIYQKDFWQLGVEVYGGVLLNPWFDRELSLAGRASVLDSKKNMHHCLVDFKRAVGMIPSLAIHLDREANNSRSINAQTDLPVVMSIDAEKTASFKALLLEQVQQQYPELDRVSVVDYEMNFYDQQKGGLYGVNNDFLSSARLDNLLSCFVGLEALLNSDSTQSCLLVCNDHEEVGSNSAVGADGPMLQSFLQRLMPEVEDYNRMISQSMMISSDNAHGIHPNFAARHDGLHGPLLNAGPVIKINANQRYASNSETQAIYRNLCLQNNIPVQSFVVRSDMACGSTIGPITASQIGVKTVDIGVPTFAMHSIRETAGSKDCEYLLESLKAFYQLAAV